MTLKTFSRWINSLKKLPTIINLSWIGTYCNFAYPLFWIEHCSCIFRWKIRENVQNWIKWIFFRTYSALQNSLESKKVWKVNFIKQLFVIDQNSFRNIPDSEIRNPVTNWFRIDQNSTFTQKFQNYSGFQVFNFTPEFVRTIKNIISFKNLDLRWLIWFKVIWLFSFFR